MASLNAINAVHATLLAATVDRITLTAPLGNRIKVTNRDSSTAIYYRFDGIDPTVGGAESFVVLPADSDTFAPLTIPVDIRVIATLGVGYSVTSVV